MKRQMWVVEECADEGWWAFEFDYTRHEARNTARYLRNLYIGNQYRVRRYIPAEEVKK